MEKMLKGYVDFLKTDEPASKRFWELEKRIKQDKKCPGVLITDMSKASAIYDGVVLGSEGNAYNVHVETMHPRKSVCNCPFAEGRRVVCKHMIALYFTAEPKTAGDFLKQVEEWEKEEEEQEKQHYIELREYVNSLTKVELRERLYEALVELEESRHRYW